MFIENPMAPGSSGVPYAPDPFIYNALGKNHMQHMPQSQYLTPSSYGMFRGQGQQGFSGRSQANLSNDVFLRQLTSGFGGMMGNYYGTTQADTMARSLYLTGRSDLVSGGNSLATFMGSMGGTAMGGFLPGMVMGSAASLIAKPFVNQSSRAFNVADRLSNKFYGFDGSSSKGLGYNSAFQVSLGLDKMASRNAIMDRGDFSQIMDKASTHGLLDFSKNEADMSRTIGKLSETFISMAKLFGDKDLGKMVKSLQRLKDLGADPTSSISILREGSQNANILGMSYDQAVAEYGATGSATFAQYGQNAAQGERVAIRNAANLQLQQRLGLATAGTMSRLGGISGGAQSVTAMQAKALTENREFMMMATYNRKTGGFDTDKLKNMSYEDMLQVKGKLSPDDIADMIARGSEFNAGLDSFTGRELDALQNKTLLGKAKYVGKGANLSHKTAFMNMQIQAGSSPEAALAAWNNATDPRLLAARSKQDMQQNFNKYEERYALLRNNNTLYNRVRVGMKSFGTDLLQGMTKTYDRTGLGRFMNDETKAVAATGGVYGTNLSSAEAYMLKGEKISGNNMFGGGIGGSILGSATKHFEGETNYLEELQRMGLTGKQASNMGEEAMHLARLQAEGGASGKKSINKLWKNLSAKYKNRTGKDLTQEDVGILLSGYAKDNIAAEEKLLGHSRKASSLSRAEQGKVIQKGEEASYDAALSAIDGLGVISNFTQTGTSADIMSRDNNAALLYAIKNNIKADSPEGKRLGLDPKQVLAGRSAYGRKDYAELATITGAKTSEDAKAAMQHAGALDSAEVQRLSDMNKELARNKVKASKMEGETFESNQIKDLRSDNRQQIKVSNQQVKLLSDIKDAIVKNNSLLLAGNIGRA